jgi:lipopolysaccharide assembly outer membrane protein LptD (OstA)
MRTKKYWIGICLLFFAMSTNGQVIKGFVAAGINLAQVDGDEVYGYKLPGSNFGIGALIPIKKNWDVSLETSYSQKGANQKAQYIAYSGDDTLTGAYKLRLNYAEIPVMIHYTDKEFITVGTGFSFGRLVGATEFEHGKQTITNAQNGVYSPNDYSVLIDLKMRVVSRLKFNFRYQYSMTKIRMREFTTIGNAQPWNRKQYNNLLTFRLVYIFNEDQSERALIKVASP